MTKPQISIIGLGKLGASLAAAIASKGFQVIGVDHSPQTVALINQGQAPVFEPGLAELMAAHRDRLTATSDYRAAITATNLTLVVVPTPSEDHGGFSLRFVVEAAKQAGRALTSKRTYHLFSLISTVLPGSTRYGVLPALEQESGKRCGVGFGLCYSPAFIALGTVIQNFLNPDFVLIGESDERAGSVLADWYHMVCDNPPPVARMSFENAELTKLALNSYITMKICYANMLADLCGRLPGGDIDAVTAALGLDSRIGKKYLKGGLGYGGPCFPRDNSALEYLARQLGSQGLLPRATDQFNRLRPERVITLLKPHLKPGATVAILGLSYKIGTNVVEESQSLEIARGLVALGHPVVAYDPVAVSEARQVLGDAVTYAGSLSEALRRADAVVIANPLEEVAALSADDFPARRQPVVVLDCWRLLREQLSADSRFTYLAIGLANAEPVLSDLLAALWHEHLANVDRSS